MDDVKKLTPEETVEALRHCVNNQYCTECVMYPHLRGGNCTMKLCAAAANTIEELLAQEINSPIMLDVDFSDAEVEKFRKKIRESGVIMPLQEMLQPTIEIVWHGWIPVTEPPKMDAADINVGRKKEVQE